MNRFFSLLQVITAIIFFCCSSSYAYTNNSNQPFTLKNETKNLLSETYSPEFKIHNFSEDELFYRAMNSSANEQFEAGLLFGRGKDVKRDFSRCVALFERAAEKGHPDAAFLLGTIYLKGGKFYTEVKTESEYGGIKIPAEFPYDITRAFHYFLISGSKGDKLSQDVCAIIKNRLIESKADSAKADKMRQYLEDSSRNGNALAKRFLGELYSEGRLVENDDHKAFSFFKESAELGDAWSQYSTARKYISGLGVEQNTAKGFEWMKKAAEQNLAVAQFDLGVLYYLGSGTAPDRKMGYAWIIVAKQNGHEEAEAIINEADGSGLTKEDEKSAYEIAGRLLALISTGSGSDNLITALSKY